MALLMADLTAYSAGVRHTGETEGAGDGVDHVLPFVAGALFA